MKTSLLILGVTLWLAGCTVGIGKRTIIKATEKSEEILNLYPHLLTSSPVDIERVVVVEPSGKIAKKKSQTHALAYDSYLEDKYSDDEFKAAKLSFIVLDRGKRPSFLPIDVSEHVAKILTADSKLSDAERIDREELLKARLRNVPDFPDVTVLHHIDKEGREVYYYYPRIAIDFSTQLISSSPLDRFSFLAIVVKLKEGSLDSEVIARLKEKGWDERDFQARVIDFSPKAADIAEYSRGQFAIGSQVQAKASYSPKGTALQTQGTELNNTVTGSSLTQLADVGYTYTESYTSELKDAIEKRNTGLLEDGRLFYGEFRSIREKRIGGTYHFDLMLEIPAFPVGHDKDGKPIPADREMCQEAENIISVPLVKELRADVFLVGVVRHVYDRGYLGVFNKVPESENDHVYEQVVLEKVADQLLWKFEHPPWFVPVTRDPEEKKVFDITVYTNEKDARFALLTKKGEILAHGGGDSTTFKIELPWPDRRDCGEEEDGSPCNKAKKIYEAAKVVYNNAQKAYETAKEACSNDQEIDKKKKARDDAEKAYQKASDNFAVPIPVHLKFMQINRFTEKGPSFLEVEGNVEFELTYTGSRKKKIYGEYKNKRGR